MTETPQQDRIDTGHLRDYSQLRRSVTDRKIAGVAGGLGRHLNIDPTILRVAFVVLALFGGAGLLLYGALWLFVPEEGSDEAVISTGGASRNAIIIVAGVLAVLLLLGDSAGGFGFPWPLAVIALVAFLVLLNRDKAMSSSKPGQPWTGGSSGGGPAAGQPPAEPGSAPTAQAATDDRADTMTLPPETPYYGTVPPGGAPYQVQQPPPPRPDRGPRLFWLTLALLAVALGALGLYDVTGGGVADAAYPALALTVIGLMLVVGAWFGRPGGLIALGVVATIALLATSVAEPRFAGERWQHENPRSAAEVQDRYYVPAGRVHLDLSDIHDVEELGGQTIDVEANAGELVVILPKGVDAAVDADVAFGEVTIEGDTRGGTGVSVERTINGGEDVPEIDLNLDLAFGSIEVRQ